ncbi:hypothetical protein RBH26_00185 [Natronolimnohabitans sp. A-GB9]|uniref:hypothetical protein n=1 Tax=Natronolimnohabitans sp. A-GB9 TaxID=3069757 RepID=UPI0027B30DF7|nr:hypothetical protein [Natronolimnohabitans sp. A-GB9]MDQ2048895.1 hypothetical protein [Natronolimnohabitans sp. A-GB9]
MTGERPRFDRRRLLVGLAGGAAVAVAGCSAPGNDDVTTATTFTRAEAESILTESPSAPTVDRPVPIEPAKTALEAERYRVDDLLAAVPEPITADEVPNGVVRNAIADRRDGAIESLEETVDATGPERYHALRTTRDARDDARTATVTWSAIDADRETLLDDLGDERRSARSTLADRLDGVAYRGEDGEDGRLRAALFYAELEDDLETATRRLDRWNVDEASAVVDLGEAAGDLEFATATTAVWDHCRGRYADETGDRADLEPVFADALEASRDRVADVDLPDQDGDDWLADLVASEVEQGFDQTLLWDAVRPVYRAADGLEDALEDGRYGPGLSAALRFEHEYRAFEDVRERFESGAVTAPESIDEIRAQRTATVEAAESAIESVTRPSLGMARLADTVRDLGWTDDAIRRSADGDPEMNVTLGDEYSEYVCLEARFTVLPDALAAFRSRLLEA